MPHSTGVVAMGPVGIVNACNPWQAALQAYELATMMHVYDVGFLPGRRGGGRAAVAAACRKDATVASVLDAAVDVILPVSGAEMAELIRQARQLATDIGDFDRFRAEIRGNGDQWLRTLPVDPRETVPVALAIFALAKGDPQQAITCAARFGRAADAIGCIAGTVSGAFSGAGSINPDWLTKLDDRRGKHETLATGLAGRRPRQAAGAPFLCRCLAFNHHVTFAAPSGLRESPWFAVPLGGICQACSDVVELDLREVLEQLILRHAAGQVTEDVPDRYPSSPNARPVGPDLGIETDVI